MLNRRDFSALAALPALGAAVAAQAQGGPVEGKHFRQLKRTLPTAPGKIEVVEFFWYGCPHCAAFEPALKPWVAQLPADVAFRQSHVAFRASMQPHQRMFFALSNLGREAALRQAIFRAIHIQNIALDNPKEQAAFFAMLGLDSATYLNAYNAFSMAGQCSAAVKLSEDYAIDGVPEIGIGGRFLTAPSMASGGEPVSEVESGFLALTVADLLIHRCRTNT